jgi:hypothetical protein
MRSRKRISWQFIPQYIDWKKPIRFADSRLSDVFVPKCPRFLAVPVLNNEYKFAIVEVDIYSTMAKKTFWRNILYCRDGTSYYVYNSPLTWTIENY